MNKIIITVTLLLVALNVFSVETGGHGVGNGGDGSEVRFGDITQDLRSWIINGGPKYLKFPNELEVTEYSSKMLSLVAPFATTVSFTTETILVGGVEKTCKNYISNQDKKPNILCNIDRFNKTAEAAQYQLVHHEFAGLAGFEKNIGTSSDYIISSQLSAFLAEEVVLKLAIKPVDIGSDYDEMIKQEAKRVSVFHAKMANYNAYERVHKGDVCEHMFGDILNHYLTAVENDHKIEFNNEVYEVLDMSFTLRVAEKLRRQEYGQIKVDHLLYQLFNTTLKSEDFHNVYFETMAHGAFGSDFNFTMKKDGTFNFEKLIFDDVGYHWEKGTGKWKIIDKTDLKREVVISLDFGASSDLTEYYRLQYENEVFRLEKIKAHSEDDDDITKFYSTFTGECEA